MIILVELIKSKSFYHRRGDGRVPVAVFPWSILSALCFNKQRFNKLDAIELRAAPKLQERQCLRDNGIFNRLVNKIDAPK